MRNFKRMSVVLSLAIALTSVFSNVAFAVQRSLTWDDIPNLFFDDPQKPPKDMPVDNPENPDYDDTTDEGLILVKMTKTALASALICQRRLETRN